MDKDTAQRSPDASGNWQFKPGDTVGPGAPQVLPPTNTATAQDAALPAHQQPMPHPDEYLPDNPAAQTPPDNSEEAVSWSGSEFIEHHKSFSWYAMLGLVTIAVAAVVFLATRDKISTGMIIFAAIILGFAAARKPRTLNYHVNGSGLTIGQKFYGYDQFRSFAVVDEQAFSSVVFMPLRRFMPSLTIYYEPKDEKKIVDILVDRLPMEPHELALIDQLMRRIRF
jgi:hypothetical protein